MADRLPPLASAQFPAFYRDLYPGRDPYRWQVRAADELVRGLEWEALEAPTGSGKTTLIECYLFALACQAGGERSLPLRLFWVVDRRAVVDAVFRHAENVLLRLSATDGDMVATAADRLRSYSARPGREAPFQLERWRGGLSRGVRPLSPMAPAVVCSTVDQVGSRLLFRGYGTSRRSRPIDAALVGTDSLIVLDEAHLSGPFEETVGAVREVQLQAGEQAARPLQLFTMSATLPPDSGGRTFRLSDAERAEPSLEQRLSAVKRARVTRARTRVDGLVREATVLSGTGARVIGAIANTVTDARAVQERLSREADSLLVIGPSRPLDRDALLERIPERSEREGLPSPLFVVATQTIEVGLDLDLDALVTASAPFTALAQRFGRLDRAGQLGESEAAIVASNELCPVYGDVPELTWNWLAEHAEGGVVEMGPSGIDRLRNLGPPPSPTTPRAPILAPWHLEALAQTTFDPIPSPDIELFLHGEEARGFADVQLSWREDLHVDEEDDRGMEAEWADRVRLRRPHPRELLALPVPAVRRWLSRLPPLGFGDVESVEAEDGYDAEFTRPAPALRVPPPGPDGPTEPKVTRDPAEIRPGDVLVVPAAYGGCDEFGWAPESREKVVDLGDLDPVRLRIRVDPRLPRPEHLVRRARDLATQIDRELESEDEAYAAVIDEVRASLSGDPASWLPQGQALTARCDALKQTGAKLADRGRAIPYPPDREAPAGLLLIPERPRRPGRPRKVLYRDHVRAVERRAEEFAHAAGFDELVFATVRIAARYHDVGKLDPRFQAWLNAGSSAYGLEPLAKSGRHSDDPRWESDRRAARWPRGKRHEALSAVLLGAADPIRLVATDRDLALFLVAAHHGEARPFYGGAADPEPVTVTAPVEGQEVTVRSNDDLPWGEHAERFGRLLDRYGLWGLASIEAALVLADRTVSAEEEGE